MAARVAGALSRQGALRQLTVIRYSSTLGWEESTWLAARNARKALGIALTGMERDGEITPARASQLAHMVMHDNAAALYHLKQ